MHNKQKLLLIHIPKTAGTSINSVLLSNKLSANIIRNPLFSGHDPYFYLQSINNLDDIFTFSVVRNPYTRVFSFFKNFVTSVNSFGIREVTFNDFLRYIRSKGTLYSAINFNHMSQMFYDQLFFIQNDNSEIQLSKLYRFEQIQELETDLQHKLFKVNSSNYTENEYLQSYTKQNINLVYNLFYRDFCMLNYSVSFEDSYQKIG